MKKRIYYLAILFFIIDIIVKQIVVRTMDLYQSIKIIPNFFYLTYTRNTGAAFSILQNQSILILLITVIALFVIYRYINKETLSNKEMLGYSLIIGGTLGNLWDRIIYKYVIDFFDFRLFGYHYPVFNTADSFIVIGIIFLIIISIIKEKKKG